MDIQAGGGKTIGIPEGAVSDGGDKLPGDTALGERSCPGAGGDLTGGTYPFVGGPDHHAHGKEFREKNMAAGALSLAERKVEGYQLLLPGYPARPPSAHVLSSGGGYGQQNKRSVGHGR